MGRFLRFVVGFVAVVVIVVVAGATMGGFDRPTVETTNSHVVGVNATTTLLRTDIEVSNPNPIGVHLGDATVTDSVTMNGIEMGTGTKHGLRITKGTTNVTLTTAIDNRLIPAWWMRHVENGERTTIDTAVRVSVPVLGRTATRTETTTTTTDITGRLNSSTSRPVNASLPFVSDPVFVVNRTRATWGTVTRETTPLDIRARVYNPKPVAFTITRLEYTITMNGVTVGNGTTGHGDTIPAGGHRTLRTEAVIQNARLDEWWVTHIRRNQHTDLHVAFTAVVGLPNGDTVRVPLSGLGYTTTIDTHLLETGDVADRTHARRDGPNHGGKHGLAGGPKLTP